MTSGEVGIEDGKGLRMGVWKRLKQRVWPCSDEYMSSADFTWYIYLEGDKMLIEWTWEEWEVSVLKMHIIKFPNNQ